MEGHRGVICQQRSSKSRHPDLKLKKCLIFKTKCPVLLAQRQQKIDQPPSHLVFRVPSRGVQISLLNINAVTKINVSTLEMLLVS